MTERQGASAKIVKADAVAEDSSDIYFDNGSILLLSVDLVPGLPGFAGPAEDDRIYYPKTDGSIVYRREGPRRLSVAEILEPAGMPGGNG